MKIDFTIYTPQELRDEIEKFLQSNKDAKTAAYMAIQSLNQRYGIMTKATELETGTKIESEHKDTMKFIKEYQKKYGKLPPAEEVYKSIAKDHLSEFKDYYTRLQQMEKQAEQDMEKATKNIQKLIKKVIINKKGQQQTVYVKPEGSKTEWLGKFMNFFNFKSSGEVNQRIEADYKRLELDKKGVTWSDWKDHISEYFSNKDKWDKFFSGKTAEKKEQEKKAEAVAKKADKKPVKQSFKLSLMKMVASLYGTAPEKKEEPVKVKPVESGWDRFEKVFGNIKSKEIKKDPKANEQMIQIRTIIEAKKQRNKLPEGQEKEKLQAFISQKESEYNKKYGLEDAPVKPTIADIVREEVKSKFDASTPESEGWSPAPGAEMLIAPNKDIIDKTIKTGEWFIAGDDFFKDKFFDSKEKAVIAWKEKNLGVSPEAVQENNFETMPETLTEVEPKPVKEEPKKTGEESIQEKFERWKSGDLTGVEGSKFYMTQELSDGKTMKTFFDEVIVDKLNYGMVSYIDAIGGRLKSSGGMGESSFIEGLKNGSIIPVGLEKPVDTGNGSKIETVKNYTPAQRKEVNNDAKEAAREGYFNERPAEILNVGKDVWGAARHNYDTYKQMNADVNQMEKDGTAQAYVTKKNLFGDYGLANKDERVSKGETEFKVLASFVMREYLAKMPPNNPEDRAVYMDFCRAISRLDQETTDAKTFYFGVADVFANMFPTEAQKPATPGQGMSVLDMIPQERKGKKPEMIIGPVLTALFYSLNQQANQSRNIYYTMDKKERKQMDIMSAALLAETGKTNKTYNQLEVMIFGETKLSGVKAKKGDAVVFAENLKDRVYVIRIDFASDSDKSKHDALMDEVSDMRKDENIIYASNKDKARLMPELNKKYGTDFDVNRSGELSRHIEKLANEKIVEAVKYRIRTKIFPEEKGQIIRVGKSSIDIAFKFPDGRIRGFNMKPSELKPENVESAVKDIKGKTTRKLNLAVEKKVIRKGGKSFEGLSIAEMQNKLSSDFQFKAIQYGNSVPDDERQYHTKWALESMSDLAEITGLPIEQITARGKLAIAFGARGRSGAAAHYEPGMKIINLTRANGYGSLAHEWAHFMDNILSPDMNDHITLNPKTVQKEVNSSNIKIGSIYEHETRKGKKYITERYYYDGKDPRYPFAKLSSGQSEPDENSIHSNFYKFNNGQSIKVLEPDNLPFMDKAVAIAKKSVESLRTQAEGLMDAYEKQNFLKDNYLNKKEEAFARAFEAYVADKLESSGRKNTYLASVAKTTLDDGAIIYPQGEFRKEINAMFDDFFVEINKNQEMKKAIDKLLKQNKNVYIKKINPVTGKPEYRKVK
jgi:sulfur relay (sulfurtransferase) DsrC/TusE family protein